MNAIQFTIRIHTRSLVSEETKDMLRAIARAGLDLPTEITKDVLKGLYDEALAIGVKYNYPVWISKKAGRNSLTIKETPVVSETPVENKTPAPEDISVDDFLQGLFNNSICGQTQGIVIPPAIPVVKDSETPFVPVVEPKVNIDDIDEDSPVVPAAPVVEETPVAVDANLDLVKKLVKSFIQNGTNNNQRVKNFISFHMAESKIATQVIGHSLRYSKKLGEEKKVLSDAEKSIVHDVLNQVIDLGSLRLNNAGTGFNIPMQTMAEYGKDYYSELYYEESALRMHDKGEAKFFYIIKLDTSKILCYSQKTKQFIAERDISVKSATHINATCNLVGIKKANPSGMGGSSTLASGDFDASSPF